MNYLASGQAPRRHGQRASEHRALSGLPGRRRAPDRRRRQRRPVRPLRRRCLGAPELARTSASAPMPGRVRASRRAGAAADRRSRCKTTRDALARGARGARACRPARSTRSPMSSPIRRSSRGACGSICRRAAARGGAIPSVRSPIVMDGQPMAAARPSPRLGEHTDEVLNDPSWT